MLDKLKQLFFEEVDAEDGPNVELAAAALLLEVVHADHNVSDTELAVMGDQLRHIFTIDEAALQTILQDSAAHHDDSVGVFPFTRIINEHFDEAQKFAVVLAMWRIAYADSTIDRFEEHTIRRIAELLYLPHDQFIAAKLQARG